ncbi:universal stress protein [Microbacterium sp. NPDC087589]|uniref:universal stress protein n=1 Tax=Microbacterium sp. NPDC087589 TaxID=3364191 RepID=UPI00382BD851
MPDIDLTDRSGVVVGIDGSADSERALEFAAEEADKAGDVLTAVTTWTTVPLPLGMHGYPSTYLSGMQQAAEETLAIALAGIGQKYPDLVVHRVVERGSPGLTISDRATESRLAVVGSHGRGAIARFLLGSTSEEVLVRLATATVVVR